MLSRIILGLVVTLLVTLLLNSFNIVRQHYAIKKFLKSENRFYSYSGEDIPAELPGYYRAAAMVIEPSDRYPLTDDRAWASSLASKRGFIRLGPKGRPFGISLYHQLHCVNALRFSYVIARDGLITDKDVLRADLGHANHCFQFLRQSILCKGDLTLVPSDGRSGFNNSATAEDTPPPAHRCRDWTQIREFVDRNQDFWRDVPLLTDTVY